MRLLERVVDNLGEQRSVGLGQRETLLPRMREALALRTPGIEVLARGRSARFDLRENIVDPEHEGDSAVATGLLDTAFRRAETRVADRNGRVTAGGFGGVGALEQRGKTGAHRAGHVGRANLGGEQRGGADDRSVELLGVGRRAGREEERIDSGVGGSLECVAQRLDRHRDRILVEAGDGLLALARYAAEDLRYRGPFE